MPLLNPTFQEAGAAPGTAKHWTVKSFCQAQRIAAFDDKPAESFEGWTEAVTAFAQGMLVLAFFDPKPRGIERFDRWLLTPYLTAFDPAQLAQAALSPDSFHWFDLDEEFDVVPKQAALFSGKPVDDFEKWSPPNTVVFTGASFDGAFQPETFEGVWTTTLKGQG